MTVVPVVLETDLWVAELNYLATCSPQSRTAQFAIRTAVRAQCLAEAAGTDAIDELLDAHARVETASARLVLERAMCYLRADQRLTKDLYRGSCTE